MADSVSVRKSVDLITQDGQEVLEHVRVIEIGTDSAYFDKCLMTHLLVAVQEFSNPKAEVAVYLLTEAHKYPNNMIPMTTREVAQATGRGVNTVDRVLKILAKYDIIRRKTSKIWVSPKIIFRGTHRQQMDVLIRYRHVVPVRMVGRQRPKNVVPIHAANRVVEDYDADGGGRRA